MQGFPAPASDEPPHPTARRTLERLRRSQDFTTVMRGGPRARHPLLTVVSRRNEGPATRIGLAVSRHVGGAVVRNRVKRQLRMVMRALPWRPGFDIVIVPQPACASARFEEISAAIASMGAKLHLFTTDPA